MTSRTVKLKVRQIVRDLEETEKSGTNDVVVFDKFHWETFKRKLKELVNG